MTDKSITQQLEAGERARLIPVTSPGQKELAAVSVVLAVFRIVPGKPGVRSCFLHEPHNRSQVQVLQGPPSSGFLWVVRVGDL